MTGTLAVVNMHSINFSLSLGSYRTQLASIRELLATHQGPIIFAAALSTVLVNPIQEWITRWSENRFQKNLVILRDELPDTVRDLRETGVMGGDRR